MTVLRFPCPQFLELLDASHKQDVPASGKGRFAQTHRLFRMFIRLNKVWQMLDSTLQAELFMFELTGPARSDEGIHVSQGSAHQTRVPP
jgi:hypothetical protein